MTVTNELSRKTYTGDGLTTAFSTSPMVFFDETDLLVYVITTATGDAEVQSLTTDYTVTGGNGSTGTVTMLTAPSALQTLLIKRAVPYKQETDFINNDSSDAEVLEDALDEIVMGLQQLAADKTYAVRLSDAETPTAALTTLPFDRASKYLAFNSDKELEAVTGSDGTSGVLALALAASSGSSLVGFAQSGSGALTRTVSEALRALVRSGDFNTLGNYDTARAALTEKIGVLELNTNTIDTRNTSDLNVKINGVTQAAFAYFAGAVDYWTLTGNDGSSGIFLKATGASIDIHCVVASKGAGPIVFATNGTVSQAQVIHAADSTNVLTFAGGTTGSATGPTLAAVAKTSGDTTVNMTISATGSAGRIKLSNGIGVGVGGSAAALAVMGPVASVTSGTSQYGIDITSFGNSDATSSIETLHITARSAAASFTCSVMNGIRILDGVKGAGSTITTLEGIRINDQTQGGTNIGLRSIVSSGSAKWNIYAEGTAQNHFAGNVGIGITVPLSKLHIEGASGWIIQDEQDANPTTTELDANDAIAIYNKANKLVFAYNNAATMTYVTLDLDGSDITWSHGTSAP